MLGPPFPAIKMVQTLSPISTSQMSLSGLCMAHLFRIFKIHYKKIQVYKALGVGDTSEDK